MTLKQKLDHWVDLDGAAYYLAISLGLMTEKDDFCTTVKWVFWSANPIGNMLYGLLVDLVKIGVLERNDDDQVRWNPEYQGEWNK